jgi:NAD-dependent SIR2 family protein deacetylase
LASNESSYYPEIMFFLGAGASVPAGIKDVIGLVADFREWIESSLKLEDRKLVEKIIDILEK